MNAQDMIRQYFKERPGQFFDGAVTYNSDFSFIEYNTYQRSLQRLVKEGVLQGYSKGTYFTSGELYQDQKDLIVEFYTEYHSGMLVGPAMYKEECISNVEPKAIDVYTNKLSNGKNKKVNEFRLTGVDLSFDYKTKAIICTLELIKAGKNIDGIDFARYQSVREHGVYNYSDAAFVRILKALKYSHSVIVFYAESLDKAGKDNHALEIYEQIAKGRSVKPEDYTARPKRIITEVEF